MNIKTLQRGLKYRSRVAAVRQTYYVFEATDYFFVLSFALSKSRKGSGLLQCGQSASGELYTVALGRSLRRDREGRGRNCSAYKTRSLELRRTQHSVRTRCPEAGDYFAFGRASAIVFCGPEDAAPKVLQ